MYCPQCSQEQMTAEMRYCSRCGFPLATVAKLIANGGVLAGFDADGNPLPSKRRKGIRIGGTLMIVSALLTPFVGLLAALEEDFVVLFLPIFFTFLVGLIWLLLTLLRKRTAETKSVPIPKELSSVSPRLSLPQPERLSVANSRTPHTAEMVRPPSVTENTTRLLDEE